jgi:hypothetical protein
MNTVYSFLLVYLTTLSNNRGYIASNGRMTVDNELGSIWKEADVTYLAPGLKQLCLILR